MTIYYQTKDHWEVVSGSEGSVFKKSIPHCMTSASIYVFLWYLMEYCDYDWSQPDGAPVSFDIATLFVSFALIVLFKIAYKRYEKAAQGLSRYHYCVKNFALKIVVFSGLDNSSDANKWRLLVKDELIHFIRGTNDMLMEPTTLTDLMVDFTIKQQEGPFELLKNLTVAVCKNLHFLQKPLSVQEEIKLHKEVKNISVAMNDLFTVVSTPLPFPLHNVMQVATYLWIIALPFYQRDFSLSAIQFIIFNVYIRTGLNYVACEITDPFGRDDLNDLEVEGLAASTIHYIERILECDTAHYFKLTRDDYGGTPFASAPPGSRINKDGSSRDMSQKYQSLGFSEMQQKNFSNALIHLEQAAGFANDPIDMARILEAMGDIFMIQGQTDEGIESYEKVINASHAFIAPEVVRMNYILLRILKKVGDALFEHGRLDTALQKYCALLPLQEEARGQDHQDSIWIRHRIGLIYFHKGEYSIAIDCFWCSLREKRKTSKYNDANYVVALEAMESASNEIDIANMLFCLGLVHDKKGENNLALSKLEEALLVHKRQPKERRCKQMMATVLAQIGRLHGKNGDLEESEQALKQACQLAFTAKRTNLSKSDSALASTLWEDTLMIMQSQHKQRSESKSSPTRSSRRRS